MPGNPKLIIDIITDASKSGKGIDEATGKFGKFNAGMSKLVAPAAGVLAGIAGLGVVALDAASDLQQAAGGVEAVFGDSAAQIKEWASTAAESVGLSSAEYQKFAAQVGAQLKNLGVPMENVAGQTDDIIKLGADLAATYGGTTADAVSALGSAFRGEADPAERYGLALNQTAVNAELAARGQQDLEGSALTAAKAQIIMDKATTQAGDAVGQFGRESDTVAGQQQRLSASISDMAAELGTSLLPIISPIVGALADFAKWVQKNSQLVTLIIGIIGALAAAVLVYAAAQAIANAVMYANPIVLIIAGIVLLIGLLIALVVWIANNTEAISKFFDDVAANIQVVVDTVANWFKSVWTNVTNWFKSIWTAVVNWFRSIWESVAGWFKAVWAGVSAFFSTIFNAIRAVVNNTVNGIRSVVGTVANWFKSVWEGAVKFVSDVFRNLGRVFSDIFNAMMAPIRAVVNYFNDIVGAIQDVIGWLGKIKIPDLGGFIGGIFGGGRSAATAGVAPAAFGVMSASLASPIVSGRALTAVSPRASVGVTNAGGTVININGGLDSADTIARRVRQLLTARDRRESGVNIRRSAR